MSNYRETTIDIEGEILDVAGCYYESDNYFSIQEVIWRMNKGDGTHVPVDVSNLLRSFLHVSDGEPMIAVKELSLEAIKKTEEVRKDESEEYHAEEKDA